jgi:hypothetical protein
MKKFIKENKTAIVWIIVALIVGGGFIISQGIKADAKRQAELDKVFAEDMAKSSYLGCKNNAFANYSKTWENECETRKLGENCSLPLTIANLIDASKETEDKDCLEIYKIEMK